MNEPLPHNIREFIAQQIESVAQLETLLLLRQDSGRGWTAEDLSRRLYLSEQMCRAMLEDLERRRYVVRDPVNNSVAYSCSDLQADALLGTLESLYRDRRVAIISEIHSNPISKVQTFADAFRLRKDGQK